MGVYWALQLLMPSLLGAKTPGQQYPQCWSNSHCIGLISCRNVTFIVKYMFQKIKSLLEKNDPVIWGLIFIIIINLHPYFYQSFPAMLFYIKGRGHHEIGDVLQTTFSNRSMAYCKISMAQCKTAVTPFGVTAVLRWAIKTFWHENCIPHQ